MGGNLSEIIDDLNVEPQSMDFEPMVKGRYRAVIVESDVVDTKKGDGKILKMTHEIDEGEFKGRKIFSSFNVVNPSDKAQAIARGQLSACARACGKTGIPEHSMDLHDIPHLIKLDIEKKEGYEARNVIKGFYKLDSKSGVTKGVVAAAATDDLDDLNW